MEVMNENCSELSKPTIANSLKIISFSSIKLFAIIIQLIGISLNVFVLYALLNVKLGSRLTTLLLSNQCVFDCLICMLALLKVLKTERWYTGYIIIDSLLCYLWFSYTLFWFVVLLSLSNMMCTALDRLGAVVYSRTYQLRQNVYITLAYTSILIYSLALVSINPLLLQYRDKKCYDTILYDKKWIIILMKVDSVLWPCLTYLFPCILTISVYAKVITILRNSTVYRQTSSHRGINDNKSATGSSNNNNNASTNNNSTDNHNNSHRKASNRQTPKSYNKQKRHRKIAQSLTIATCIMQTIFLITHSYDRIYYFLGIHRWISYQIGCTTHVFGLWLVTLNSCISPSALIFTVRPLQVYLLQAMNRCCCACSKKFNIPVSINYPTDYSEAHLSRNEHENRTSRIESSIASKKVSN
uniref:G-protein coupled receptors family 1 profile domain-containing protein n=1 Tax=Trichobilharzia regenti TaxID=157069 RepID=A0AA85JU74_TRIRE|nr:unnamed protein product [Trichobilharzia regenti]